MELFDRQLIKMIIKEKGLNYEKLAEMANMSLSTIKHLMSGENKNPRLDTIEAIYKALGLIGNDETEESIKEIINEIKKLDAENLDIVYNLVKNLNKNKK